MSSTFTQRLTSPIARPLVAPMHRDRRAGGRIELIMPVFIRLPNNSQVFRKK